LVRASGGGTDAAAQLQEPCRLLALHWALPPHALPSGSVLPELPGRLSPLHPAPPRLLRGFELLLCQQQRLLHLAQQQHNS
ncbi:unnamed protein product, partial [Closterium sp. Yama58-4]